LHSIGHSSAFAAQSATITATGTKSSHINRRQVLVEVELFPYAQAVRSTRTSRVFRRPNLDG
jgi:hypothetical protein